MAERTLSQRVGSGAGWSVAGRMSARLCGFVTMLVLARLISPEAFGLVGLGLMLNGLVEAFSDVGLRQYLIQRQARFRPLLGAAWTFVILRSALISLVLVASAPWLARAFDMPEATGILRIMGLIPLLRGLLNIEYVLWMKQLDFRRQFVIDVAPQIGILVVGVSFAILAPSAWALAFGYLAGAVLQLALSFVLGQAPPRLRWSLRRGRLMLRFGVLAFLGTVVGYAVLRGGEWLTAALFDAHDLGLYVLAFTIAAIPSTDLLKPIGRVLFPAFAMVRDDPARLEAAFCRSYAVLATLAAPICIGLALVAGDFSRVLLGPAWTGIEPVLQLAALTALFRVLSTGGLNLPYALDRPEIPLLEGLFGLVAMVAAVGGYLLIVPGADQTLVGIAACVCCAQAIQSAVRFGLGLHIMRVRPARVVDAMMPTLCAILALVTTVLLVELTHPPGVVRLVTAVLVGGMAYVAGLGVFFGMWRRGPIADALLLLRPVRSATP